MERLASRTLFWSLLNLVLAVVLIFGLRGVVFHPFYDETRTITVAGEGKVTVSPDIAKLTFSVVSEGKDPKKIQQDNTAKMDSALKFIKDQGIADKDIKTSNYSLYPVYDYNVVSPFVGSRTPFIVGYRLTQTVSVKIRDLTKTGDVLGGLATSGVNSVDSFSLDVDAPEEHINLAREDAFKDAFAKAKAMAKANNVRVRRVVTFSESGGPWPRYYAVEAFGKGGPLPAVPTIEPGTQDVTVDVSVTYEIR